MWDQIERNKRGSVMVVTTLGVLLVAIGMAVGMFFSGREEGALVGGVAAFGLWVILWLTMRSRGDDIMLGMAGARQIEKKDHPQLFNIVDEMTIASGLPKMPRVFIVDDPAPSRSIMLAMRTGPTTAPRPPTNTSAPLAAII